MKERCKILMPVQAYISKLKLHDTFVIAGSFEQYHVFETGPFLISEITNHYGGVRSCFWSPSSDTNHFTKHCTV